LPGVGLLIRESKLCEFSWDSFPTFSRIVFGSNRGVSPCII
jgi:hypothetical protein